MARARRRARANPAAPARQPEPNLFVAVLFGAGAFAAIGFPPEPARWLAIAALAALAMLDLAHRAWRGAAATVDVLDALLAGLIVYGAASLLWSSNPNGGTQAVIIAGAAMVLIAYLKRAASRATLFALAAGTATGVAFALASNLWLPSDQVSGYGNTGYAAQAFVLTVPLLWPLWRTDRAEIRIGALAVAAAAAAYVVVFTPSFIGYFVAAMFAAIVSVAAAFRRRRAAGWLAMAAWLAVVPAAAWLGWDRLHLTSRLLFRAELWLDTALMAATHPLFGGGLGSFIEDFPLFKEAHGAFMPFVNDTFESYVTEAEAAHNEPVQLAAELGLVGLAGFLAILTLSLRAAARRVTDPFAAAGGAALVALTGMALLEYPFQRAATLLLAILAFGFAARGEGSGLRRWTFRLPAPARLAAFPATAIAAALLLFAAMRQFEAEARLETVRAPGLDPAEAFALAIQAHELDPLERRVRTTLPVLLDGLVRAQGLAAAPPETVARVFAWADQGGHFNTAALVARAQFLLNRDAGDDADFAGILADLKRGSTRVAAVYTIEARYLLIHGDYVGGLAKADEGLRFADGVSAVPGADAAIKANLIELKTIAERETLRRAAVPKRPPEPAAR